ncbi:MAG: BatD family protein [Dissulfuribacterales bacterium]
MLVLICLYGFITPAVAGSLSANIAISNDDVFVGEPFTLQIQVSGSDSPQKPDLSAIDGFNVVYQGGSQNSSSSVIIINGKMTKNIRKGYVFSFQLTPLREGTLTIPSLMVHSGGDMTLTRPVSIRVKKPMETDDFKLRLHLSKTRCYVGEPVILSVTWYLGSDVQNADFTVPVLAKTDQFYIADPKVNTNSGKQYYRVPLGSGEVIAEKGTGTLNGKTFATLSFEKVLIPKRSGLVSIDPATVSCRALVGYRKQRNPFNDDSFSNFFNNDRFGMARRGVYQQTVVPSNALTLKVLDLPAADRPSDFSGLVGEYHIEASAKPTTVNVGDPITLTIALSGPDYLEPVELPPLSNQKALASAFKIPSERASGEISGNKKIFTQTIRPLRAAIKEIPPIRFSYFDPRSGTYKTDRTVAIPLAVSQTRIVTAQDAEGISAPISAGNDVKTWMGGIAHNYEDISVLGNQILNPVAWLASPQGIGIVAVPPILYFLMFITSVAYRRKKEDPMKGQAKKAGARLAKAIHHAKQEKTIQQARAVILDAFKTYLGDKLRIPAGALTFDDVAGLLSQKGAEQETLHDLKILFSECEAARYGQARPDDSVDKIGDKAFNIMKKLEKLLK